MPRKEPHPTIRIPGATSHTLTPHRSGEGAPRYLKAGRGAPLVLLHMYQSLPSLIAARTRYRDVAAPVHLVYGERDWSRPSDREANRALLPDAEFTQVPGAGHFIALERPDALTELLNAFEKDAPTD